jgi:hypothetical protein
MPLRWEPSWTGDDGTWLGYCGQHRFARVLPANRPDSPGHYDWQLSGISPGAIEVRQVGFETSAEAAMESADRAFDEWLRMASLALAPWAIQDE